LKKWVKNNRKWFKTPLSSSHSACTLLLLLLLMMMMMLLLLLFVVPAVIDAADDVDDDDDDDDDVDDGDDVSDDDGCDDDDDYSANCVCNPAPQMQRVCDRFAGANKRCMTSPPPSHSISLAAAASPEVVAAINRLLPQV
jgi:hypothetical protein